jgi:glutamate/tyrosine decarboxylase-like PLP-dependent enzyme
MDKATFLGPKAENADELERLLLEVLHDHVFWRRNFHPADPRLIAESDKRTDAFGDTAARLRDELFQILAELKRGAPLFSPRQVAHMVSEPSLPALVGYFAGLLYNQNNVVAEAAPETVRKEHAFMAALARMVSYPELLPETLPKGARRDRLSYSWGHMSSGGTAANLEALWVARNVRMYPLAVRLLASREPGFAHFGELDVRHANGLSGPLLSLKTFELLNLPIPEVTNLHLSVQQWLGEAGAEAGRAFEAALPSVRKLGLAGLMHRYNEKFSTDPLRPPVAFMSQAAHYGWGKAMDVVGLGAGSLRLLPVDRRLRLDTQALVDALHETAASEVPVLMTISILGTTEEGAVDPVHRIEEIRRDVAGEGITFWHHVDAAFGGYLAAALPRDDDGYALPYDAQREDLMDEDVYRAVAAVAETDSITIDPHKWGYVPYPAGAVLFRDYHCRDAIGYAAPYLNTSETTGFGGFLGRWTLEGSRPGAPAVGAYLSQVVLPLDETGHGALVRKCLSSTRRLVGALKQEFGTGPVRLGLLAEPDTVGFCFVLIPEGEVHSVSALNAFTRRLWEHVNVDGRDLVGGYQFILSKTEMEVNRYRHVLAEVVPARVLEGENHAAVMFLRAFVLNPFISDWAAGESRFEDVFVEFMRRLSSKVYLEQIGNGVHAAESDHAPGGRTATRLEPLREESF